MPAIVDPRISHGVVLLAIGAVVVASWQVPFRSTAQAARQTRERVMTLRQQVTQLDGLIGSAGGEAVWMANQQQALAKLKTRIPPSGQMPRLLDVLLDYVERASLKVVNVQQGTLAPAEDEQHVPIVLDGAACFSLPVTLSVEGSFRDVVAFLERVASQKFPGLVTVDRVHLASKDPFAATLSASLQLVLYVVGT